MGREALTTVITEKQDKFGEKYKDKTFARVKVTPDDIKALREFFSALGRFSEELNSWLIF